MDSALQFLLQFGKLVNDPTNSNVMFVVGKEETQFYALTGILQLHSPVFASMFKGFFKESASLNNTENQSKSDSTSKGKHITVQIPNIQPEVFEQFVHFCYTRQLSKDSPDMAFMAELWMAADQYNVKVLLEYCEEFILSHFCVDNVLSSAHVCLLSSNLTSSFLKFLSENLEAIANGNIEGLSRDNMKEISIHEGLSHRDRFRLVYKWSQSHNLSGKELLDLLKYSKIHFNTLPYEDILELQHYDSIPPEFVIRVFSEYILNVKKWFVCTAELPAKGLSVEGLNLSRHSVLWKGVEATFYVQVCLKGDDTSKVSLYLFAEWDKSKFSQQELSICGLYMQLLPNGKQKSFGHNAVVTIYSGFGFHSFCSGEEFKTCVLSNRIRVQVGQYSPNPTTE